MTKDELLNAVEKAFALKKVDPGMEQAKFFELLCLVLPDDSVIDMCPITTN